VLPFSWLASLILSSVGVDSQWFESTSALYDFCYSQKFKHTLCPPIFPGKSDTQVKPPSGGLTPENLYAASVLYQKGQSPLAWLVSLQLGDRKGLFEDRRLWAEAQYLYGKILFDQKKYREAEIVYNRVVEEMKGRAVFHQERAWILFFNGKWDRALGSLVSAQSPLIREVPFFEKYFIRALIERDTCQWDLAFTTIAKGREALAQQNVDQVVSNHPWIEICETRPDHKDTCDALRFYYRSYYELRVKQAYADLDLLEVEMRDRGRTKPKEISKSELIWPYLGENWKDELGYYSIPITNAC
jgi:tetratricopeptide (TPR) repeat protein